MNQSQDLDAQETRATARMIEDAVAELAAVYEELEREDLDNFDIDELVARRRALELLIEAAGAPHPRGDR
ncbi:MAG: hypothetical protein IPH07_24185 [Deltaproteobacteria bacterium]|nr:hypothetical protein [Deltaproteobacteria bacterium]